MIFFKFWEIYVLVWCTLVAHGDFTFELGLSPIHIQGQVKILSNIILSVSF